MIDNEKKQKFINGVRVFKNICTVIVVVVLISLISIGVYKIKTHFDKEEDKQDTETSDVFTEQMDVTVYDVKHQMSPIGEMATYEFDYVGHEKIEDYSKVFEKYNVPLTKHTIDIQYEGKIKIGYEMKDVDLSVDTDKKIINVVLPEGKVLDNYVDTYSTVDKNNILNPIESDEAQEYLDKTVEPKELKAAEEAGIYEKAEENAKKIIKDNLSYFEKFGYTIEFPDSITTK